MADLKKRVQDCLEAGAIATGCDHETEWGEVDYLDLKTNWPLARAYQANAEALGREFIPIEKLLTGGAGSTDMGNVSYRVPAIHPLMACSPKGVTIHNPEFTAYAGSTSGDQAALDGAKALAMTALDFMLDRDLRASTREEFVTNVQRGV